MKMLELERETDPTYRPEILLDSGAYTAWRTGKPIAIEKYADFIHQYKAGIGAYMNLDQIIPGDKEKAAAVSLRNLHYLRSRMLSPIPVFHQGENIQWLHKMLDEGASYIALAGASTLRSVAKETSWYDAVWNSLVNAGGLPYVKVHVLGDTKEVSLAGYPWASADSSSWGSMGRGALLRILDNGGRRFTMTVRRDGTNYNTTKDIGAYRGEERKRLAAMLASYGVDYERLLMRRSEDHVYRLFIGLMQYKLMMERVNSKPRPSFNGGINIFEERRYGAKRKAIDQAPLKLFLASWLSREFCSVFQTARYPYVLLSYAWMIGASRDKLRYGMQFINGEPDDGRTQRHHRAKAGPPAGAVQGNLPSERAGRRTPLDLRVKRAIQRSHRTGLS